MLCLQSLIHTHRLTSSSLNLGAIMAPTVGEFHCRWLRMRKILWLSVVWNHFLLHWLPTISAGGRPYMETRRTAPFRRCDNRRASFKLGAFIVVKVEIWYNVNRGWKLQLYQVLCRTQDESVKFRDSDHSESWSWNAKYLEVMPRSYTSHCSMSQYFADHQKIRAQCSLKGLLR